MKAVAVLVVVIVVLVVVIVGRLISYRVRCLGLVYLTLTWRSSAPLL